MRPVRSSVEPDPARSSTVRGELLATYAQARLPAASISGTLRSGIPALTLLRPIMAVGVRSLARYYFFLSAHRPEGTSSLDPLDAGMLPTCGYLIQRPTDASNRAGATG